MIVLNERELAENCIRNGVYDNKPLYTVNLIARYYYHCLEYRKKKITALLFEFLEKHYPRYIYTKEFWADSIEKAIYQAQKRPLYENNGVSITQKELDTIASLHDKVNERLAFTVLCIAKLNSVRNENNNGWVNNDENEIFRLARIYDTVKDRQKRIGMLYHAGLIELSNKIDCVNFRVTFIDDDPLSVLFISDFRELGYEYSKYKGGNFIRCKECGILIRGNKKGTKKYCSSCIAYTPLYKKTVTCIDCGIAFSIPSKNNRTTRCPMCYHEYRKERKREIAKKNRATHML